MTQTTSTALTTTQENTPPAVVSPEGIDILADAVEFEEKLDSSELQMPFLNILQALSPQVTEGKPEYDPDARKGEIINSVTKERIDGKAGFYCVLVSMKHTIIEWVPRSQGGGFVGEYPIEEQDKFLTERTADKTVVIKQGTQMGTPGNELRETYTHYVLVVDKETGFTQPALISMSASGLRVSRELNSRLQMRKLPDGKGGSVKAPRWYDLFHVTSQMQQNADGSWYTWKFSQVGPVLEQGPWGKAAYLEARQFNVSIRDGLVKASVPQDEVATQPTHASEAPKSAPMDDDIPF